MTITGKKPNLLCRLVLCLTLLHLSFSQAQTLGEFFDTACTAASEVAGEDVEWLCTAGQLIGNVEEVVTSLHTDMADFAQNLFGSWFDDTLLTLGADLPGATIDEALSAMNDALDEGPAAFRAKVGEVLGSLRQSNRRARAPEGSPDWWLEQATRANPNLAINEARDEQRVTELATMNAEARAAHAMNEEIAQQVSESTSARDTVANVLGTTGIPGLPNPNEGTAAELEENARLANSTRTALVYLSEGFADLMRQDAAFSGAIIEHLRVLSQQEVMTTWQLQHAVSALVAEQERQIARERARLQTRLAQQTSLGQQMGDALTGVAGGVSNILEAETADLKAAFSRLNAP